MMDILGIAKFGIDIFGKIFSWGKTRNSPTRKQAQRVIDAFESHGILRHQITRLLPPELAISTENFDSPDSLKSKLSPNFLNWVATTLNLQRGWLDGTDEFPHEHHDIYKDPARTYRWIKERQEAINQQTIILHVLAIHPGKEPCEGKGKFCVVLEECFGELDKRALSRYYTLTHGWNFEHTSCLIELTCLATISEILSVSFLGAVISEAELNNIEKGKVFIPEVLNQRHQRWKAVDLVPVRYKTENLSEIHREVWEASIEKLRRAELEDKLLSFN